MTDKTPTKIVIDMAGAMEKFTPEMMDKAKDIMIEALINGGKEHRKRADSAEAERDDLRAKVQAMHRRAQAAEGKLARQSAMVRKVVAYMEPKNFRPHYVYRGPIQWLRAALAFTRGRSGAHFDIDFCTRVRIEKNAKGGDA